MMHIADIFEYRGRTISRYEWNRINERLNGMFSVNQHIDNETGIMKTTIRQRYTMINGRIQDVHGIDVVIYVKWNDLYKRKLLLINRKK